MRYDDFIALALYDPEVGYYRKAARRVGYGRGTDFFTATTSGALFGELICAACAKLLPGKPLSDFEFIEVGAEPEGGVLREVAHPFRSASTRCVGEPLEFEGDCVVFSNELFDAQPFRRFVRRGGKWHERGVRLEGERLLEDLFAGDISLPDTLPAVAGEGYELDLPFESVDLMQRIAAQPWSGLLLAFDYGKSWAEMIESCPGGTARAYHQHTQHNDLLARPGDQDLTCHICWDWLKEAATRAGFRDAAVESQESFFVHQAGDFIGATIAAEAARMSPRKLSLMQLLHPAHLGQKFQVLHARRLAPCAGDPREAT